MTSSFLAPRTTTGYLLAGALFTCAGIVATPWESEQTTRAYLDAMAANPTRGQVSGILSRATWSSPSGSSPRSLLAAGKPHRSPRRVPRRSYRV